MRLALPPPRFVPEVGRESSDLVDAAYRLDGDLDDWLAGVLEGADELDQGLGAVALVQDIGDQLITHALAVRGGKATIDRMLALQGVLSPRDHVEHFATSPFARSGSYRAQLEERGLATGSFDAKGGSSGVADMLGIFSRLGGNRVLALVAFAPSRIDERAAQRRRWNRVAEHLQAGLRLRDRLAHAQGWVALESPLPDRREARAETSSLWQGLLEGRWGVVARTSPSGRRQLVAFERGRTRSGGSTLTAREAAVVQALVCGGSLKEAAFELGVSTSAVHEALTRAMHKLHVTRRAELARAWQVTQAAPSSDVVVIDLEIGTDALGSLPPALRAIAAMVLDGLSIDEIAEARGTSVHTVTNQLGALYQRLAVRSKNELIALTAGTSRKP